MSYPDNSQPTTSLTEKNTNNAWLDDVHFNPDGLIPAIAQDKETGDILMMAWMNREALKLTVDTNTAVYFSRSRNKLWHKGETSGHTQLVHDIYLDCDADVIVLKVTQIGGIACHTGRKSCFYRRLDTTNDSPIWQNNAPILKDPKQIYGDAKTTANQPMTNGENQAEVNSSEKPNQVVNSQVDALSVLHQLDSVLAERKQADASSSYVASLYHKGINKILEKVGEEAIESIIAAKDLAHSMPKADKPLPSEQATQNLDSDLLNDLIYETADVWFHTLVTLAWFNIGSDKILAELARRFGLSGIEEKNSRTK